MTAAVPIALGWVGRDPPLSPLAVVARGQAALRLADRLASSELPCDGRWRGLGDPGGGRERWLLVLGDEPPWVDGAAYLGRDPAAPRLLLPTALRPDSGGIAVAALLDRAIAARCAGALGPFAVVPDLGVVATGAALAIAPAALAAWRRR